MIVKMRVVLGYKRTHYADGEFLKVLVEMCFHLNEEISRTPERLSSRYIMESAK
jgi:hypothetical protein